MPVRRADALAIGAITLLTLTVLVPVVAQTADPDQRANNTLSNAKQLAIANLMYCQDYDETYALAVISPKTPGFPSLSSGWASVTQPYIKNFSETYRSPGIAGGKQSVQFMFNDLAGGQSLATVESPKSSLLLMDGEDVANNTGHAWSRSAPPVGATIISVKSGKKTLWKVAPGAGARVQSSPTRFAGKGVYAFLDGHAKMCSPEIIFFPPRSSSSPKAPVGEPKPGASDKFSFRLN
jgi:prepilin-type processing-associated H-X9-DG protein